MRAESEPETNAVIRNANDAQPKRNTRAHIKWASREQEDGVAGHGALQDPEKQRKEGRQDGRKDGSPTSVNLPPLAMWQAASGSGTSKRWLTQHAEFDVHLIKNLAKMIQAVRRLWTSRRAKKLEANSSSS